MYAAQESHLACGYHRSLLLERAFLARDHLSPAGAKDDSRDAEALADALRTDRRCFRLLAPLDPVVVELREWTRIAEELRVERTRLSNQVRELLWRYYPQFLELCDDVAADWVLDLWRLVPTPAKARRVREAPFERLLKRHRIRRITAAAATEGACHLRGRRHGPP